MKKLLLLFAISISSIKASELDFTNSKDLTVLTEISQKENTPIRTITIWGRFRNIQGIEGGVVWGCTHMPVVCAQYEICEEGPLQQDGTFRAIAFNPDGSVAEVVEYTKVIVSNGETDDEVILNFILP